MLTDGFPYFLYTAGVGQSGPDNFTYRALDSRGNQSGVATATLSISATNTAPSCPSIAFGVEPGASVRTPESFCQDPDAHWPVTHTIVTPPAKGTVRLDGESTTGSVAFRYTPLDGASGGDAFTFTATDAFGATSAPATATINIAACTTTTLPVRRAIHVWYGSAFNGASTTLDATQLSDLINDGVRAALISDSTIDARGKALAAFRDFNPLHTNIAWVVDPPQNLPAESRLRAALAAGMTAPVFDSVVDRGTKEYLLDLISNQELCDGGPVHDVQYEFRVSVSFHELNVREGNRAPACAARTASVSAGVAADIAPSCSDADLDPLTLSIASQGTKGVASIVGGQLRYTANPGTQGSDTFTYIASDGRGGVSPAAIVSVTINPVVTAPTIGIGPASVVEGTGSSPSTLRFTVSLSAPAPSGGVSVNFATANGTASAPSDFASRGGTLLFAAGEQSRPVDVAVVADSLQETNETLQLVLSSPVNATLAQSTATGTIVNDDAPQTRITASIVGAVCVSEPGRGERGYAKFAVTLSAPAPKGGVTVTYSTRSITAKASADFASTSGTLRIDAGQTMKRISVQIYPDNNRENDETFAVDLGTVRGATLGTGRTAIATISQRCQACDRDDER